MVIKVYMSSISGNKEIKRQQDFVLQILQTKKVDFEKVDITDPSKEDEKMFMRENSKPKEGQRVPLPPQIFNETDYCGDYDGLYEANECEEVLEFLKLLEPTSVSKTTVMLSEQTEPIVENDESEKIQELQNGVTEPPVVESTQVSKVTLGVLATAVGDENDNVKGETQSSGESSDEHATQEGAAATTEFPYERLTEGHADQEEVPPVKPRALSRSEHRKSKELHDYENVTLTQEIDIPIESKDTEHRSGSNADVEKHDDSLSLHDSIEENEEQSGDGDGEKLEDGAEQ